MFFPELAERTIEELIHAFETDPCLTLGLPEGDRPQAYGEVAIKIAQTGERWLDWLIHEIPKRNDLRLHAVLRLRAILLSFSFVEETVREQRRPQLRDICLSFAHDERPLIAADAIDSLCSLGDCNGEGEISLLLHHESPYVVGSALRFLSRRDPEKARPLLIDALDSPQPLIRQNAADELDQLGCLEALPRLRRLLNDEDPDVRQAARTAVLNLEDRQALDEYLRR